MATLHLIGAYLDALHERLPADIAAELTDGLLASYDDLRDQGLAPDAAAEVAIADFGTLEQVTAAFAHIAPGRRLARGLLATGPLVGGCWATVLVTTPTWRTMPAAAHAALPLALLVVSALAVAWRGPYRRIRPAAIAAGTGLVALDAAALTMFALLAPTLTGPLVLAATASACRLALTLRALPRLRPIA
ncbi:permease prefix domain 1-containing protein [Streptomyces sp. PA03-1a]|nr:permease prefix domain 1-containing protein [Streptomyces sp. PA03-1a]